MNIGQANPTKKFIKNYITQQQIEPYDALKEYIDNSIDAGATFVRVHLQQDNNVNKKLTTIEILDNGKGMSLDRLQQAWTLGTERVYEHEHGTFGIGLTTATFSIVGPNNGSIRIITTQDGLIFNTLRWEPSMIDRPEGIWSYEFGQSTTEDIELFHNRANKYDIQSNGTLIILEKPKMVSEYVDTLREHLATKDNILGVTYAANIRGKIPRLDSYEFEDKTPVKLIVNSTEVSPYDPFEDDEVRSGGYDTIDDKPLKTIPGVRLRAVIIHEKLKDNIDAKYRGFYCRRNGRFLTVGRKDLFSLEQAKTKLLRVELIWDSSNDITNMIQLSHNKNDVKFSKVQIEEINHRIMSAKNAAMRAYSAAEKKSKITNAALTEVLNKNAEKAATTISQLSSSNHISPVMMDKEKRNSPSGKTPTPPQPQNDNKKERNRTPKSVLNEKVCSTVKFEYEPLGRDAPYVETRKHKGQFIITINESTEFFKTVYLPAINNPEQLLALNLWYYGIAHALDKMTTYSDEYQEGANRLLSLISSNVETLIRNVGIEIKQMEEEDDEEYDNASTEDFEDCEAAVG